MLSFFKNTFGSSEPAQNNNTTTTTSSPAPAQKKEEEVKQQPSAPPSILVTVLSNLSLGTDLLRSGVSLPVQLHEPMTNLGRHAEMLAHCDIIDNMLLNCKDSLSRMAYIATFGISALVGTERLFSDFNPMLGETFEWIDKRNNTKFLAEQISHHPPASACHAENSSWTFWQNSCVKAKFLGNSIEIDTQGRTHIYLAKEKDHFFFTNPKLIVHNLILGSMWIEHYGDLAITNLKNGENCTIVFKKAGFFEGVRYDIDGYVKDSLGNQIIYIYGHWNKSVSAKWLVDTPTHPKGHTMELFKVPENNFVGGKYNFTRYATMLLEIDDEHTEDLLPGTDSRLRLDRRYLAKGDIDAASKSKRMLEEKQRADRKQRETSDNKEWEPIWFKKIPDEQGGSGHNWVYCGNYWSQREQKKQKLSKGEDPAHLLKPIQTTNLACDFKSYQTSDSTSSSSPVLVPVVTQQPLGNAQQQKPQEQQSLLVEPIKA